MGWITKLWNIVWTLGRRRVEAKGAELIDKSDALSDDEKALLKEAGTEALDDIKEAGDDAVEKVEKKAKKR